MAIRCINVVQVVCDLCGKTIFLERWQDAAKLGWCAPCDGMFQWCPKCLEKERAKMFAEAAAAVGGEEKP